MTVFCNNANQAAVVFGFTACPHFDSKPLDHDIFILTECFSMNRWVHCFLRPLAGNLFPNHAHSISWTCSLSRWWLSGKPRLPSSVMYSMMMSVSALVTPRLCSICGSSTPSPIRSTDECQHCQVTKLYLLPSFHPVQIDEVFCNGACSLPMWFLLLILIGCNCSFFVLDLAFLSDT